MAERQPPKAQDKLAFLLALVPYLMDRDRVSVTEAAEHFDVPAEQLRDAVRLIAVSGIPGETASYQHGDLFDIAWDDFDDNDQIVLTNMVAIDDSPRFSAREATAFIAGLQYLSSLPEYADRAAISTLSAKLTKGSSSSPTPVAVQASETDETLGTIRESVERGVQVEFDYLSSRGERERRRVDPLRVESVDADWYLRGWCHLREAVRTFRLDRLADLTITDVPITREAGDVALPETLFEGTPDDLLITLDVAPAALPLLEDYMTSDVQTQPSGDRVRTVIRVSHVHGLKRLIASMPGVATVVGPAEARDAVAQWAREGAAKYTSA